MRFWIIPLCVGVAVAGIRGVASGEDIGPQCSIVKDLVADFEEAKATNASAAVAGLNERSGGVTLPGIFLHPSSSDDAVLTYGEVAVPRENPFLLFRIGMREGVPWGSETDTPNGVRFLAAINGRVVFQEDVAENGWKDRAISLADWRGQRVVLELRTNAIEGRTNYDWASFGDPIVVRITPATKEHPLSPEAVGVTLARIQCGELSQVSLGMGERVEKASLPQGIHYLPIHFNKVDEVRFRVESGSARLLDVMAAPFVAELEFDAPFLSSPLVTADSPFAILRTGRNVGRGVYTSDEGLGIAIRNANRLAKRVSGHAERIPIGRLEPGEEKTYVWRDLVVPGAGDYVATGTASLAFHVFPASPETSVARIEQPFASTTPTETVCASVGNAWGRLSFVREPRGDAYAVAETWNGGAWQRVGSVYPLAYAVLLDDGGVRREYAMRVDAFSASGERLVANGHIEEIDARRWPIRLTFTAFGDRAPIRVEAEMTAGRDASLLAFYGPTLLAGDRAYGVEKDFAIFPGVEYLEGDEASSSTRDLAYPLSDRRVPAAYKIATPLMAVQGDDSLFALLWDAKSPWTSGATGPAARFLAPAFNSGYEHIRMALLAPSVGEWLAENRYEANVEKPYPLKLGQAVRVESWFVIDHKARYAPESVVNGPHQGGLVLQAMQHWFDIYGVPEPSPQPRDWETERALCRDAYFNAVWNEDPPGWRHCAGMQPGPFAGHAVPQLMQIREGTTPEVRAEIERRIDLVISRALKEHGPQYLGTNAACHIVMGELPFYYGFLPEALTDLKVHALSRIGARENGLWIWRPSSEKHASLGQTGDHTLGQASSPSVLALRVARMTGDPELAAQALDAMKQMERYDVPRGAQTWECPLYQPDILAAGQAIRAYCEAYRLTGDAVYLQHARYWAWSGLPFIYMWELDGYPTMRYNVIAVIGSTFYTHSWLGMPVVWCGLVYAYGLQDLAQFDDSFPWNTIAQGIVNSTMWQQYSDGASKGCYPDSWNMVKNAPNPADIGPENILMNEYRLRGPSPEIRFARLQSVTGASVMLNSAADIANPEGTAEKGTLRFTLTGAVGFPVFSLLAPVVEPAAVIGSGDRVADSAALQAVEQGWLYDPGLKGVVLKTKMEEGGVPCEISW